MVQVALERLERDGRASAAGGLGDHLITREAVASDLNMISGDGRFFDESTKIGRLRRACFDKVLDHERDGTVPTNGRFLFYELEQDGVIPKTYRHPDGSARARQPRQDISDALMDLRKAGLVPGSGLSTKPARWRRGARRPAPMRT